MDVENYSSPISDKGWGGPWGQGIQGNYYTANPYETDNHVAATAKTNITDKSIKLLIRPVRVLDHRHLEIFRHKEKALSGTAAGRYGVFLYDAPSARATDADSLYLRSTIPSPNNPPYPPVYHFWADGETDTVQNGVTAPFKDYRKPTSVGPKIAGYESSTFSDSLSQTVARITVSDNTLQHLRADNPRQGDFSVQPRYSQSLHPGTNLNKSSHSGESDHTDNRVND